MTMHLPDSVAAAGMRATRPTYVYDLERLHRRCERLDRLTRDGHAIFFATMANDHPDVLAAVRALGHGIFVNSPRHLELARALGFPANKIIYAASNMQPEEMQRCAEHGVHLILDSLGQLKQFADLSGPGAELGLRLSVGSTRDGGDLTDDPSYRFGLVADEIPRAVAMARDRGVRIVGAHAYFGTDVMRPEVLLGGMRRLAEAAQCLPDLRYLDVAGGLGVAEGLHQEFDIERYARGAAELLHGLQTRLGRRIDLLIEPGRYLVADCGYFFVRVVDVKLRPDRAFVGTNGSVAIFPRPLVYPDRAAHPCELIGPRRKAAAHPQPLDICGNSTYSRDFLARQVRLPLPAAGDLLVFHKAGAYCRSMITDFLGKERPDEIVVGAGA